MILNYLVNNKIMFNSYKKFIFNLRRLEWVNEEDELDEQIEAKRLELEKILTANCFLNS